MNNIIIEAHLGEVFHDVAFRAQIAADNITNAEFDFNGIKCVVSPFTDLEALWRDYSNAHFMDWASVGPDCDDYDDGTKKEIKRRRDEQERKDMEQRAAWKAKDALEKEAFLKKVAGVEIDLTDKELWERGLSKNQDPYGKCIYEYAESWARLMQVEISEGKALKDIAESTSHQLGFLSITGFMYGAAVSVLSHCWKHGEELRKWHNKEYGHEGDGVVNPAILTVGENS